MKIETIVVPIDFSGDSDKAFEMAMDLARDFRAGITLVHAFDFGK